MKDTSINPLSGAPATLAKVISSFISRFTSSCIYYGFPGNLDLTLDQVSALNMILISNFTLYDETAGNVIKELEPARFMYLVCHTRQTDIDACVRDIEKDCQLTDAGTEEVLEYFRRTIQGVCESYINPEWLMLWKWAGQRDWKETLASLRIIESQKGNTSLLSTQPEHLFEIATWKIIVAANTKNGGLLFEGINNLFALHLPSVDYPRYHPTYLRFALIHFIIKEAFNYKFGLTPGGKKQAALERREAEGFGRDEMHKMQHFIAEKIIEAIFETKIIKTEAELSLFIRNNLRRMMDEYLQSQAYLEYVTFEFIQYN